MNEDIIIEDEDSETEDKIKKIKDRLKKCISEKDEYLAGWQRAKADLINARKEDEERFLEAIKFSEKSLINDILVVLDSFESAFFDKNWQTLDKIWQDGIKLIYNQLLSILREHSLEPLESLEKKFNPYDHEAVGEIEVNNKEDDGIVKEEIRKGYKIQGKIIRPAQVKVGKYVK